MTTALTRLPKSTVKLTITLSWEEVKNTYQKFLGSVAKNAEIPGFRKGKAPKKMVEDRVDKTKLYEEVIRELVPKAYADALKEHHLHPIVSPRVNVISAAESKDWQFEAVTCEQPEVKLGNYRIEIAKLKGAKKIWVPGATKQNLNEEEEKKGASLSEILTVLLQNSTIEIPDLLIEDQVNKKLTDLIDQVKTLGMSVEQYLLSKGITSDQLKVTYRKEAEDTLKLEFILESVADQEKITVSDTEIEAFISKGKDEKEKNALKSQKYYISMLLRRQKTIDSLSKPIV